MDFSRAWSEKYVDQIDIVAIEKSRGVDSVITISRGAEVVRYGAGPNGLCQELNLITDRIYSRRYGWTTTEGSFQGQERNLVDKSSLKEIFPGLQIGDELTPKVNAL